jgi:hypothetical protein
MKSATSLPHVELKSRLVAARVRPTSAMVGLTDEGRLNLKFAMILILIFDRVSAQNMPERNTENDQLIAIPRACGVQKNTSKFSRQRRKFSAAFTRLLYRPCRRAA